ncbi:MAG: EthD family reductase [Variovorax sp.]
MFKLVFLLKRRPDLTVPAFHAHLRDVHGPRVCEQLSVRRYVQSYTLPQGYAKGELLFDGIEELWFHSAEARGRYAHRGMATAASNEDFLDTGRTVAMPVDVHVMKDGTPVEGSVKSIEFVNRRPDMPLERFGRYWREHHGPLACHIEGFRRYEQNHLCAEGYAVDPAPAFDGLAVTWFDSTEEMKKTVGTPAYEATRQDEANFLQEGHLPFVITRESQLKG